MAIYENPESAHHLYVAEDDVKARPRQTPALVPLSPTATIPSEALARASLRLGFQPLTHNCSLPVHLRLLPNPAEAGRAA